MALALALLAGQSAPSAHGAPPDLDEIVTFDLVSEVGEVAPGRTIHLGAAFEIEPEWHLYWKNSGDTGMPITLRVDAPPGFTVGEPLWPTPKRYEHTGLLDYIYEDRVTLIVPVTAAPGLDMGRPIEFRAQAQWLMCKSVCLPGDGEATLSLPVAARGSALETTSHAPLFAASRERIPTSWRPGDDSDVQVRWRDGGLAIDAPDAASMTFFPLAPDDAPPVDAIQDGHVQGSSMLVRYDERIEDAERVSGVLEVLTQDGRVIQRLIELDLP